MEGYKRYLLPLFLSISFLPGAAAKSQSNDFVARFDCLMKRYKKYCQRYCVDLPFYTSKKRIISDLLKNRFMERECVRFIRDLKQDGKTLQWLCDQWLKRKEEKFLSVLAKQYCLDINELHQRNNRNIVKKHLNSIHYPESPLKIWFGQTLLANPEFDTPQIRNQIVEYIQQIIGPFEYSIYVKFGRTNQVYLSGDFHVLEINSYDFDLGILMHELAHVWHYDSFSKEWIKELNHNMDESSKAFQGYIKLNEWRADLYAALISSKKNYAGIVLPSCSIFPALSAWLRHASFIPFSLGVIWNTIQAQKS